jgi:hypothetical protein
MAQRVVIGKYNDGVTYGLRVSLPGIDALTGDSSGGDFSFDSQWTDIAKTLLVGIATAASTTISVSWVSPGYIPYGEFRYISGNSVYDDYFGSLRANGIGAILTTGGATLTPVPSGASCLYVIHQIPVMSG